MVKEEATPATLRSAIEEQVHLEASAAAEGR